MQPIRIKVKPGSHRDMVKDALVRAGWKIIDSGYDLVEQVGDLGCRPPPGATPDEFHPSPIPCDLPPGPGGPLPADQLPAADPLPGPHPEAEPPPNPPEPTD